jgi:hypothetical protein
MTATRARGLAALGVVCAAAAWLLLRRLYTALPPLPWTVAPAMLLLAIVEGRTGHILRARISGRDKAAQGGSTQAWGRVRPLDPIAVTRIAALAKASAYAAAVIGGLAAGFVVYLAGSLDETIPRDDTFTALEILVGAVILAAAALYLEQSCRVPRKPAGHDAPSGD